MVNRTLVYIFVASHLLNWMMTLLLMFMLKDIIGILQDLSVIVQRLGGT